MKEVISRDAALAALKEYNHEPFHIQHALTVEGVMRWYANELGYGEDADFWATAGLLHDIDFEMWPEQHCLKAPELLEKAGCDADLIHAVCSHGYGLVCDVEIGPKDMEKEQCCIARRDTGEKTFVPLADLESAVQSLLKDIHDNLYAMAEKNLEDNTFDLTTWEEVRDMAQGRGGFARTKWCGSLECELAMKEKAGVSSRCMPLKQSGTTGKCPVCGKECTTDIYWGVAY